MVAAARKNKISVQVGSQGRSEHDAYLAHRYLAGGAIGKIRRVDCWHYETPRTRTPCPTAIRLPSWTGPVARAAPLAPLQSTVLPWRLSLAAGVRRRPDPRPRRSRHELRHVVDGCRRHGARHGGSDGDGAEGGLWDSAVTIQVTYTFKDPDWILTWNQPESRFPGGEEAR